jgi:L-asparaginase II
MLLLCKLNDWSLTEYWHPDHPVQRLYAATVARAFGTTATALLASTDACGVPTYAFPLREIARAFALLADPSAIPESDLRSSLADALTRIRDAMLANPEMIGGSRDRIDTSVMKAAPGRVLSKGGAEGLRGFAILPRGTRQTVASGVALKIEDGAALRALARYQHPKAVDPRGEAVAEAIAEFELAPVGELLGTP